MINHRRYVRKLGGCGNNQAWTGPSTGTDLQSLTVTGSQYDCSSVGRTLLQYRRGYGLEFRLCPDFFTDQQPNQQQFWHTLKKLNFTM